MSADDAIEQLFARGVTDGLPVVPPTRERVEAAIAASGCRADDLIARVAPAFGRATVERIAVNAVMAGCRPEYLPAVIAGVEALCDEGFSLVGVSGTTDAVAPVFVVNGPARTALDINSAAGALGPGWRANATIGRALRLIWVNLGRVGHGGVSMSTFGNPGRYACCFGEHEEASPWEPLHVEHGFASGESTMAALPGEPLQVVVDGQSRKAADVLATVARSLEVVASHRTAALGDIPDRAFAHARADGRGRRLVEGRCASGLVGAPRGQARGAHAEVPRPGTSEARRRGRHGGPVHRTDPRLALRRLARVPRAEEDPPAGLADGPWGIPTACGR